MLKKTVTYMDYNGVERTEDFYFDLNKAEIAEMQLSTIGGLSAMIERIIAAQDTAALIKVFKDLVLKAYGVKSPDGRKFMKSDALREEFEQTPAYSIIFTEYAFNADKASEFVKGIIPQKE